MKDFFSSNVLPETSRTFPDGFFPLVGAPSALGFFIFCFGSLIGFSFSGSSGSGITSHGLAGFGSRRLASASCFQFLRSSSI